jgi:hypothetical protein
MPDTTGNPTALGRIVEAHLKKGNDETKWAQLQDEISSLVEKFVEKGEKNSVDIATDQLLNAVYLLTREVKPDQDEREKLLQLLLKSLSEED